jgi:serine/threonine protein phosphatase 1
MPDPKTLSVPDAVPVFASGDIHGQLRQLRNVVNWITERAAGIAAEYAKPQAVLLGDYIDRGEDSQGVLEYLSKLRTDIPSIDWIFLAGNHEASFLSFLEDPLGHAAWLGFGGKEMLASYGITPPSDLAPRALKAARDQIAAVLPKKHLAFLKQLQPSAQIGDYIFVHAGLRPGRALERQDVDDMLWIREDFLQSPTWYGKCVVHGHTVEMEPVMLPWRIGIDTGAYAGGPLTCLTLIGNQREALGFP